MPRSRRNSRFAPPCTCLVDAYRTYPGQADFGEGCASPGCPVKNLDSTTLRQFLEAIGGRDKVGGEDTGTTASQDLPIFRALAKRRRRRRVSPV